jgi:hypothetical protein
MLLNVWNEIIYRLDVLRATNGAHMEVYWILVYWSIDWTVVVDLIQTKMSWVVLLITANRFKIAPKITNLLRLIMGWIIYGHSVHPVRWYFRTDGQVVGAQPIVKQNLNSQTILTTLLRQLLSRYSKVLQLTWDTPPGSIQLDAWTQYKPDTHLAWLWWSSEPGNDLTACVRWKPRGLLDVLSTQHRYSYWCNQANTGPVGTKSAAIPSIATNNRTFQLQLKANIIPERACVTKRLYPNN